MSEQRLIDANYLLNRLRGNVLIDVTSEIEYEIENAPTIDTLRHGYVPSSVHEQVQWERDIAIDQLHSYGVEFGEKAEMQRVIHGKWTPEEDKSMMAAWERCSVCGFCTVDMNLNYCPNCGAKMDKE